MEPERWQQIQRLCHSALELEPGPRELFLKEACAGDQELLHEVESLIGCDGQAQSFLESPAMDVLARKLALDQPGELQKNLAGKTLLHYRILERIGEGGMGQVYRAEDTNLSRQVAIKVLPDEFAYNTERLARFEREAKLLALLNHSNIASIYGLEQADGKPFLVLELVEGHTLADRLTKGRIPLDETLDICRQIAEGLEAAHEKGIIHRDLKPANVKVTQEGKVKILDFGLARLLRDQVPPADLSRSPAVSEETTLPGTVIGTAGYMSPEQARGKTVDKRADIWAFGCIFYECLTGQRPLKGDNAIETLSRILEAEPDWSLLPETTPSAVRNLIQRCLRKDPRERLRDIGDARFEIREAPPSTLKSPGTADSRAWKLSAAWLFSLAIVPLGVAGIVFWYAIQRPEPPMRASMRLAITLPTDAPLAPAGIVSPAHDRPALALSPDGTRLAYVALVGNGTRICVRDMRNGKVTPLPETNGGHTPFFSPDGASIAFFADGKLKRTPSSGGVALVLAEAPNPWGGVWGADNAIYFNRREGEGISRVAAETGRPEVVVTGSHYMPELLGPGQGMLTTAGRRTVYIEGGRTPSFVTEGFGARYVPTGHIVFAEAGRLLAAPFDRSRMVTGPPVVLFEDLRSAPFGVAQFTVAQDGTLIYASGRHQTMTSFVWVDRKGTRRTLGLPEDLHDAFDLSPDGRRLAVALVGEPPEREIGIWIYDLLQGSRSRLTPLGTGHRAADVFPRWTPDSRHVIHARFQNPHPRLRRVPVHLNDEALDLWVSGPTGPQWLYPMSFSPDGSVLSAYGPSEGTSHDIWLLRMEAGDRPLPSKPELFRGNSFAECFGEISPDGHWMVYSSNQSGSYEIYVTSYPKPDGIHQISKDGGREPLWNPAAPEIVYLKGTKVYAVDVTLGLRFRAGEPRLLFEGPFADVEGFGFDITADGQRFLMLENRDLLEPATSLVVITNFFNELRRRVPSKSEGGGSGAPQPDPPTGNPISANPQSTW